MKNILFILMACLLVTPVFSAPRADAPVMGRRAEMVQRYNQKALGEQLLSFAKEGDVASINALAERAKNGSYLMFVDKFGNNAFHLAKDAQTVQAIAAAVRQMYTRNFVEKIGILRNQRNQSGETPLMAHINYGKADTFFLLYVGSDLQKAVNAVKAVNKGGALDITAGIKKGVVVSLAQDASGRNVAQAARANASAEGMDRVIAFLNQEASYL